MSQYTTVWVCFFPSQTLYSRSSVHLKFLIRSEMEVIKNQKANQHGAGTRSSFQNGLLRNPPALFSFYTLLLWFSFSGMLFSLLRTSNLLIFQNQYIFSTIPFQNALGWAYSFVGVVIVWFFLMNYISYCICHLGVLNHIVVCFAHITGFHTGLVSPKYLDSLLKTGADIPFMSPVQQSLK